jgi:hypothetical protein
MGCQAWRRAYSSSTRLQGGMGLLGCSRCRRALVLAGQQQLLVLHMDRWAWGMGEALVVCSQCSRHHSSSSLEGCMVSSKHRCSGVHQHQEEQHLEARHSPMRATPLPDAVV